MVRGRAKLMMTRIYSIFKGIIVAATLAGLVIGSYVIYSKLPGMLNQLVDQSPSGAAAAGQEVIVTVPKGATLSQVAGILQEKQVVSSRFVFRAVAWLRGEQRNIKAGDYALKTGSDAGDVLDQLISGKTLMFSITIPEGYNLFQVADLVRQLGVMSQEDFINMCQDPEFLKELGVEGSSLEGYLFPDTYFFRPSEKGDAKLIVRRMVQRFYQIYDKYVRAAAVENGWTTAQVVTLASLIEKEARPSEHSLVSAVFHNRLRKNMRLQSDPTAIYRIKRMGEKITRMDLDRKHAYNTYQISGLPPGPIANPGKESLVAAVNPAPVDYLYFVSRNDGSHQFSNSLKDHNQWVNQYQRQPHSQTP
jgi:UPF0755 protein